MRPEIDWKECVKDSPKFRAALEEAEQDFDAFEAKLDKIVRLCGCVVETGKTFGNANSAFIVGLKETTSQFGDDQLITETVDKFTQALTDWQTYYNVMLEQFNVSFNNNLTGFMKNDMRKVKETKRRYHKHAEELQSALCRNAQLSRSKSDDCADTSSHVSQTRLCFTRASLEHMLEINWLQKKKRIEILNSVLSYIGAHISFVQQINDLFICLEPFRQQVETQLEELQRKAALERQAMEETNGKVLCSIIGSSPADGAGTMTRSTDCKMEGYLFKRTSNAFKSWVRRWFIVENNQLLYCSRQQTRRYGDSTGVTVIERDLRLCNVRPLVDAERRFCFQIISPTRCHVLQADSETECQSWITAIQDGASNAYGRRPGSAGGRYSGTTSRMTSDGSSNTLSPDTRHHHTNSDVIQSILSVQGNNRCCDCGVKDPCWASINFGITLCIECSGIHRSFGVHKSKVRSVTLDAWEPEQVSVMLELGNRAVNEIFEAAANSSSIQRATPDCSRSVREAWIKAKYMDKAFVLSSSSSKTSGDQRLGPPLSSSHRHRRVLTECSVKTSSSFVEQSDSLLSSSMIRQGASQDSGLGGSTDGIILSRHKNSCNDSISAVASDVLIESSDTDSLSVDSDTPPNVDILLCHAAIRGCLGDMLRFLALGANVNCQLAEDGDKTPLMKAVESGHMAAVEFLLLNGAKCDICDCQGRAALHYAAQLGHTGHICLLLKRNANQHIKDLTGLDALTIAVNNGDANVVTLLRFARLNEEMKATDSLYDLQVDDTFAAMFRDFTNLAHNGVQHSSQQNDASS